MQRTDCSATPAVRSRGAHRTVQRRFAKSSDGHADALTIGWLSRGCHASTSKRRAGYGVARLLASGCGHRAAVTDAVHLRRQSTATTRSWRLRFWGALQELLEQLPHARLSAQHIRHLAPASAPARDRGRYSSCARLVAPSPCASEAISLAKATMLPPACAAMPMMRW